MTRLKIRFFWLIKSMMQSVPSAINLRAVLFEGAPASVLQRVSLNFYKDTMMTLKQRFLEAVVAGELGIVDDVGVVVTLKQFKECFTDIKTDYINSYLPASTIEPGRSAMSHTRFLYRIRNGVYRVHPDVIEMFIEKSLAGDGSVKEPVLVMKFDL